MDELTQVREMRDGAPVPDRGRLAAGRVRLLEAAESSGPARGATRVGRLRRDWRLAAVGAVLAVTASAVIAVNVADSSGGSRVAPAPAASRSAGPATAQEYLEAAARAAESVKGQEPRDDQWYYAKHISAQVGDGAKLGEPASGDDWFTVGPRKGEETDWRDYYALVTGLPDDPAGIVQAYKKAYPNDINDFDPDKPADAFYVIQSLARVPSTPLEGKGQAKLYRALATLPGVELVGRSVKDAAGREAVAVTMKTGPNYRYRYEILLLADTYQAVGNRMVVAHDFEDDDRRTTFKPGKWKAGDVMTTTASLVVTFVDEKDVRP